MVNDGYLFVLRPKSGACVWVLGANVHPDEFAERLLPVPGVTSGYEIVYASPVADPMVAERELVHRLAPHRANPKRPIFSCSPKQATIACRAVAQRHQPSASGSNRF